MCHSLLQKSQNNLKTLNYTRNIYSCAVNDLDVEHKRKSEAIQVGLFVSVISAIATTGHSR